MGWFTTDTRADAIRAGTAVPTRTERQVCWAARDAYFSCLDAASIVDAHANAPQAARACPQETAAFERDCAAAWVKYFKQWRVADIQKRRRLEQLRQEGAQELPANAFGANSPGAPPPRPEASKDQLQDMLDHKRR
ncbi:hypothetical protein S40285_04487 [Stachybotrys chlorohalonatus IBT 40285]|uniref:Cytochrome c oxidase subunit 6B-like protein new16 n=2 Tax=Stachybotrys TaxID=74721 RepID=A0A084QV00_STAC4|nr:hypothetical protein S7711_08384 [Stachybotrys chartarum IBT 7711]KFA54081.1 hypothetical protein S40293_05523 [Stachybotrys chartarum IBT 40293]KFA67785.1 hypothetical protein S40285_04487 [Stachybotrys chlorohalonata IBT 40285]KFA76179.1 hypothetical protein S40288_04134 [Stachybotrys chartarum IBT 40288]